MGKLRWATSRPRLASEVDPSPQPGHGAYKGTLWDPTTKIAGSQVAGNSNLKLGDTPHFTPRLKAQAKGLVELLA